MATRSLLLLPTLLLTQLQLLLLLLLTLAWWLGLLLLLALRAATGHLAAAGCCCSQASTQAVPELEVLFPPQVLPHGSLVIFLAIVPHAGAAGNVVSRTTGSLAQVQGHSRGGALRWLRGGGAVRCLRPSSVGVGALRWLCGLGGGAPVQPTRREAQLSRLPFERHLAVSLIHLEREGYTEGQPGTCFRCAGQSQRPAVHHLGLQAARLGAQRQLDVQLDCGAIRVGQGIAGLAGSSHDLLPWT